MGCPHTQRKDENLRCLYGLDKMDMTMSPGGLLELEEVRQDSEAWWGE